MASAKYCCVPGCSETSEGTGVLHGFPNPDKDKQRFDIWLNAIGGDILDLETVRVYKYRRVCHKHFEENVQCSSHRLCKTAVPTLRLPDIITKMKSTNLSRNLKPMTSLSNRSVPSISKGTPQDNTQAQVTNEPRVVEQYGKTSINAANDVINKDNVVINKDNDVINKDNVVINKENVVINKDNDVIKNASHDVITNEENLVVINVGDDLITSKDNNVIITTVHDVIDTTNDVIINLFDDFTHNNQSDGVIIKKVDVSIINKDQDFLISSDDEYEDAGDDLVSEAEVASTASQLLRTFRPDAEDPIAVGAAFTPKYHCRSCLSAKGLLLSESLKSAYKQVTGMSMSDERLPSRLCHRCIAYVRKGIAFREASRKASEMLTQLVDREMVSTSTLKNARKECSVFLPKLKIKHNLTNVFNAEYKYDADPLVHVGSNNTEIQILNSNLNNSDIILDPTNLVIKHNPAEQPAKVADENKKDCQKIIQKMVTLKKVTNPKFLKELMRKKNLKFLPLNKVNQLKYCQRLQRPLKQDGAQKQNGRKIQDGAQKQNGRKIQNGAQTQNGRKIQDGAQKQQSRKLKGEILNRKKQKSCMAKHKAKLLFNEYFNTEDLTLEQQKECFAKRRETGNYANARYKCEVCLKGFLHETSFKRHMALHSEDMGPFTCPVCFRRCRTGHVLNVHLIHIHRYNYSCKECKYQTQSRYNATEHISWHRGVKYTCEQCGSQFKHPTSLRSHARIKHPTESVCRWCGYSFLGQRGVEQHVKLKHRLDDLTIPDDGPQCECNVKFANKTALLTHLNVSSRHNQCQRNVASTPVVSKDEAMVKPVRGPTIKCEQCSARFYRMREYTLHFKLIHPECTRAQFNKHAQLCHECGKTFRTKYLLEVHTNAVHTKAVVYTCMYCDKAFTHRFKYSTHLRSHIRLYTCSICQKNFCSYANMVRHKKNVHSEERKFKCEYCEKRFKAKDMLKYHTDHVHFKVPWPASKQRTKSQGRKECKKQRDEHLEVVYDATDDFQAHSKS